MATVREGSRAVLLVVDVQVGVMREAWDAVRVVGNVARAVLRARERGVPVVWVQHTDDDLPEGSPQWQWVPELPGAPSCSALRCSPLGRPGGLTPAEVEPRIRKRFNSAFEATPLASELARLGATHLVLAGAATNWCIRATAYGALERGYDLTLLADAHTTETMELDNGVRIEAARMVDELNLAITWLSYPGRRNGIAAADEVDFAVPGGKCR